MLMKRQRSIYGYSKYFLFIAIFEGKVIKGNILADVQKKSSTISITIFSYCSVATNWELVIWETWVKFSLTYYKYIKSVFN